MHAIVGKLFTSTVRNEQRTLPVYGSVINGSIKFDQLIYLDLQHGKAWYDGQEFKIDCNQLNPGEDIVWMWQ